MALVAPKVEIQERNKRLNEDVTRHFNRKKQTQNAMKTDKALILATRAFTKENRLLSWWYVLSTVTLLVLSLSLTYWNLSAYLKPVFSVLSGLLLVRMFVIYHDHQHHAILHQSKLANAIMQCFGLYILAPSSIWKRSHDFHHKHNSKLHVSDIGSFTTVTLNEYLAMNKEERFMYLLLRHPINILFSYLTVFMYSFCIHSFFNSTKKHLDCGLALLLHFGFGFLLYHFSGITALLFTLIVPHTIACLIGNYLFYAQHNFPEAEFKISDWNYEHAALNSTSYFKMNPVMKWFTANIGYHHVHHLNSRIPFYRLEETIKNMPELENAPVTTFHPKDIIKCLRLKVWDTNSGKMIGLKEIQLSEENEKRQLVSIAS